jgi:hypothetical protein
MTDKGSTVEPSVGNRTLTIAAMDSAGINQSVFHRLDKILPPVVVIIDNEVIRRYSSMINLEKHLSFGEQEWIPVTAKLCI